MLRGYKWFVVLYSSPCNVVTYMRLSTVSIIMMRGTRVTHLVAHQEQFGLYAPVLQVWSEFHMAGTIYESHPR